MTPPAAIVLGAGASRRMGRPKIAIPWRGRSFARHVCDRARACALAPIVLVWGASPPPADVEGLAGLVVRHNPHWRRGPFSSLQTGLHAVAAGSAVLVLTVDRPHLRPDTLAALLHAHRQDARAVVQPIRDGRHGHPVLLPAWVADEARTAPATGTLRDLLRRPDVAPARRFVPVDDPAVLDNLDRPEDLSKLVDPC